MSQRTFQSCTYKMWILKHAENEKDLKRGEEVELSL